MAKPFIYVWNNQLYLSSDTVTRVSPLYGAIKVKNDGTILGESGKVVAPVTYMQNGYPITVINPPPEGVNAQLTTFQRDLDDYTQGWFKVYTHNAGSWVNQSSPNFVYEKKLVGNVVGGTATFEIFLLIWFEFINGEVIYGYEASDI